MKILKKKGVSVYLGWVLLTAFMVSLSTFIYFWMSQHVDTQTAQIKEMSDLNLCELTSFSVSDICQNDYSIKINVTNTKNIEIQGFEITLIDLYDNIAKVEQNISLKPSQEQTLEILKPGTLLQVEIKPKLIKDKSEFYCESLKATIINIDFC